MRTKGMQEPEITSAMSSADFSDFSLVLGGPLFQLFRRTGLTGNALELLSRRILVLAALAWLPLLILSVMEGHAWGGSVKLTFLHDLETHVRLLIALPLMVLAELVIHQRMRPVVEQFVLRGLIPDALRSKFAAAIAAALRLRNSIVAEVFLIAFVYIVGVGFLWRTQFALHGVSWYGISEHGHLQPSAAGLWFICVSLPLFQFLLLRWYFRMFIWARFLWQVARIKLNLMPTHPDRCGGLGFLSSISFAFAPFLLAQGALLSGLIASQIFYHGAKLPEFKVELVGIVAVMVFTILGPLLVFAPQLEAARRNGSREYGILAQRYAREFDQKWLRGGASEGETLIGSADIQSLADMSNSFEVIKDMKLVPFNMRTVLQLAVITLLPIAPLLLTMISLEAMLEQLLKVIF